MKNTNTIFLKSYTFTPKAQKLARINLASTTFSKEAIRTGIDSFLGQLQNSLNAQILSNTKLPIIGSKLSNGQQIINDFRDDINRELNRLPANATAEQLRSALFAALKPLNLLQDLDGNKVIDSKDIFVAQTAKGLDIQLKIGRGLTNLGGTTSLGLGADLPGLGLDIKGNVSSQLGFDFNLKFGLDKNQTFFVDTSVANEFSLSLKSGITLNGAQGKLGPLSIDVANIANKPTGFEGKFAIDLKGGSDNRLSGAEFSNINLDATLSGSAGINLNTKTTFNDSKVLPSLGADINVGWTFNKVNADSDRLGTFGTAPTVSLNNVKIDAGSFFGKFASPLLTNIQKVYKPVEPIIDVLTKKIDLGKFQITVLDVAKALGYIDAEDKRFIESIKKVGDLLKTIKTGGNNVWIDLGNYNLGNFNIYNAGALNNATPSLVGSSNPSQNNNSQVTKFFNDTKGISGLTFPLLSNPGAAINLLLGKKDVTLFEYDLPNLDFIFLYEQFFPIIGPVGAKVQGKFGANVDLSFGFDTKGLDFTTNKFDLTSGFFINDLKENKDINELTLNASLKAFAAVSGAVAEVGVGGGILGQVGFNLKDPDKDGKVRLAELNFNDPLCMFDMSGQLKAELTAYFRVGYGRFGYTKEFNSPAVTLLDYNYSKKCSTGPTPILASKNGKGLTLNTGPNAKSQVKINPTSPKPGVIAFSSANYSVNENGTPVNVITLTRTNGTSGVVSVRLTPSNGTAIAPGDYNKAPITVTFANGETRKSVSIPIVNDTAIESNETIALVLSHLTGGATLGAQKNATLTIVDNDTPPLRPGVIAFSAANYSVNENGTPVNVITLTRTNGSNGAVSVRLTPSHGSATAPGDYNNAPITVTFANGETSKTVSIPIADDALFEGNETVSLALSNPSGGATLGAQNNASLTIVDDDPSPPDINVAWRGTDGLYFYYDSGKIVKLSDNKYARPVISGDNVVWSDEDGNDREIYLFDGWESETIIQLTDNNIYDDLPSISDNRVVWYDVNAQIYFYNVERIDGNIISIGSGYRPVNDGNYVAWENNNEIYLYDGDSQFQISDNFEINREILHYPIISGNSVIWSVFDYENRGTSIDIYFYDGETTIYLDTLPDYITYEDDTYSYLSYFAAVSGDKVVWRGWDGNDWEIYLYDGQEQQQLTDNDVEDFYPSISGNTVVWSNWDGYYLYDGDGTQHLPIQISGFLDSQPQISGNSIVFRNNDNNGKVQIYVYDGSTTYQITNDNSSKGSLTVDKPLNNLRTSSTTKTTSQPSSVTNTVKTSTIQTQVITTTSVVIKEPNNTLATATDVSSSLAGNETYSDSVGKSDTVDLYKIDVIESGALKLLLNGTTESVNLDLLDSNGTIINSSTAEGTAPDYLTSPIEPGTYYIRVTITNPAVDSTPYDLTVTTDQNEYFKVTHKGSNAEGEILTITAFNFTESGKPFETEGTNNPLSQEYSGITTITADGGLGDDIIELAPGVTSPATLTGGDGNDRITGGDGNDNISGNKGIDIIAGGKGNDKLQGNEDDDILVGEVGSDTLDGGGGLDTASYSTSAAAVTINLLTNTLTGGDAGGDTLISIENLEGSAFADSLTGDANNNLLNGGDGNDSLNGDNGDDALIGGAGADIINGGNGSDMALYITSTAGVNVNLSTLKTSGGNATGDQLISIENVTGSPFADGLTGDNGNNYIEGDSGNDYLDGGAGNDTLVGGDGDDTYIIDSPNDVIDEKQLENQSNSGTAAGARKGIDKVQVAFTYQLGPTLENLTLRGNLAIDGRGNTSDNSLVGNGANNKLFGFEGNDTLTGGAGNDSLDGGAGSDTAAYRASIQGVNINLSTNSVTGGDAQGDTLTSIENLEGSSRNDTLTGNANPNTLIGGNGKDSLAGGGGNDLLFGDLTTYGDGNLFTYSGNLYFLTNFSSWKDAQAQAKSYGGNLVTVNDQNEQNWLVNTFGGVERFERFWIGLTDEVTEGQFKWASGESLTYTNWYTDQPDNFKNEEDYVHMNFLSSGKWNDISSSFSYRGIIELKGSSYANDTLNGGDGNDTLIGGLGGDILDGGNGIDTASYASSSVGVTVNLTNATATGGDAVGDKLTLIENLTGSMWQDSLTGNDLNNQLDGGLSNDTLSGGAGNDILDGGLADDILIGGSGRDTLTGSAGLDRFRFTSPTEGVDTIVQFDEFDDLLEVSAAGFKGGLGAGELILESQFVIGSKATTPNHRFVYNNQTGGLFYDVDGTGAIAPTQLATFSPGVLLGDTNIWVIP